MTQQPTLGSIVIAHLTVEDLIAKAKVKLKKIVPFFMYIVEHLRMQVDNSISTIGVTPKSRCLYNEEFIKSLTTEELIGVLVHEVMHPALRHFTRQGMRTLQCNGISLWNWAADVQINQMIIENGLTLPRNGIIPSGNQIMFGNICIENIDTKSTEELYDEVVAQLKKQEGEDRVQRDPETGDFESPDDIQGGFDEMLKGGDDSEDDSEGDSKEDTEADGVPSEGKPSDGETSESDMPDVDWGRVLAEAHAYSKLIGKEPAGFDQLFKELHKPKVNWRSMLRKTVASSIPEEFTWNKPNKKYISHDIYMPSTYGESIKVICAIDTSGSIGEDTLSDFISEIVGISTAYHEAEFIILSHDVDVQDEIPVRNGYRDKLAKMELHGGGGTSHIPLFEHIEKNKNTWDLEATVVICFTDGYSNFPTHRPKVDQIVFVLAGGHCPKDHIPEWANTVLSIDE